MKACLTFIVLFAGVLLLPLSAFEIAKGEKGVIVLPVKSIPAEETAAKFLKRHLEKMLPGSEFAVVRENRIPAGSKKVIYLGDTGKLRLLKVDTGKFYREELLIKSSGNDLFLSGGRTRGTLYAVFDFLEKQGVVYAAKDTIYIPRLAKISWNGELQRKPAFKLRSTYTHTNGGDFKLFNKYNSYKVPTAGEGGYEGYSPAGEGHTFNYYSKFFPLDDPKVFAMDLNGRRKLPPKPGVATSLCPSYKKTADLIFQKMRSDYDRMVAKSTQNGVPLQELFELSLGDDRSACLCPTCRRITKEEGCFTGVMLRLANDLAGRLKKLDSRFKVTMLVYQQTLYFPKKTRPVENILPRICVHDNEWIIDVLAEMINPVTHKNNLRFRKELDSWLDASRQSGIWEYWTYYTKPKFPHVALDTYSQNLKYYQKKRVENVFLEFEKFQDSFFSLKLFLALKLMDDPTRDLTKLVDTFMLHYYGKGAPFMKEYLYFLNEEVKKETLKAPIGPRHPKTFAYLNKAFFQKAYGLLAKAEKAAAKDPRSLTHIRSEYVALDYALFIFGEKRMKELGLTKKQVLARLQKYGSSQIRNIHGTKSIVAKREMSSLNNFITGNSIEAPLPKEVKGDEIFDFKFNSFHVDRKWCKLVEDPDAVGGKALCLLPQKDNKVYHVGKMVTYHKTPFPIGIYNSYTNPKFGPEKVLKAGDIPQDEKYHLYKVGRHFLMSGSRLYFHWSWFIQFSPREAYMATPDYYSNIYVSLKFTGPAYVKGSKKENGVYLDRVLISRSKDDMLLKEVK